MSGKSPKDISDSLTKELEIYSEWLVDNRLSLHSGKTEAILCGSKIKLKCVDHFEVKCKGISISSVSVVKYLALNIDSIMSSESILNSLISLSNSRLKMLYILYKQHACQRQ